MQHYAGMVYNLALCPSVCLLSIMLKAPQWHLHIRVTHVGFRTVRIASVSSQAGHFYKETKPGFSFMLILCCSVF